MELSDEVAAVRNPDHPVHAIFPNRWSPRSMTGEALEESELFGLFEAARWAPSSLNEQPWRFLYARRDTPEWDVFFSLLVEKNQTWCKDAAVLIVVLSQTTYLRNGRPHRTHSLDTGMAVQNLLLEASVRGLVAHPIGGFDVKGASPALDVPEDFAVECMIAVGKRGDAAKLPEELQAREQPPGRKEIQEFIREGKYKK